MTLSNKLTTVLTRYTTTSKLSNTTRENEMLAATIPQQSRTLTVSYEVRSRVKRAHNTRGKHSQTTLQSDEFLSLHTSVDSLY